MRQHQTFKGFDGDVRKADGLWLETEVIGDVTEEEFGEMEVWCHEFIDPVEEFGEYYWVQVLAVVSFEIFQKFVKENDFHEIIRAKTDYEKNVKESLYDIIYITGRGPMI